MLLIDQKPQQQKQASSIYQQKNANGNETSSSTGANINGSTGTIATSAKPFESYNGLQIKPSTVALIDGVIPSPMHSLNPSSKPSEEKKHSLATSLQKYVQEAELFEEKGGAKNTPAAGFYDTNTAY